MSDQHMADNEAKRDARRGNDPEPENINRFANRKDRRRIAKQNKFFRSENRGVWGEANSRNVNRQTLRKMDLSADE